MSDSFADLWSSAAPSQTQKPAPLAQQKPSYSQPKPKNDVFALLSQSSTTTNRNNLNVPRQGSSLNSSVTNSRSITPSLSSSSLGSRPGSSLSSQAAAAASSSNDAFNDLFSGSLGGASSAKSPTNMTIAERAALVEKQRLAGGSQSRRQPAAAPENHRWAGLDALGGGSIPTNSTSSSQLSADQDDWGLGDFAASTTITTAKPSGTQHQRTPKQSASTSLLDFEGFDAPADVDVPPSKASAPPPKAKSGSLWDLDDFASGSPSSAAAKSTPQTKPRANFDSPDFEFDFGNREDNGVTDSPDLRDEDDILGVLSKPVDSVRAQPTRNGSGATSSSTSSTSSRRPAPRASRPSSPPPHILGQIVEMGFSVQQARSALSKTESGIDVQAALDMLLGEGGGGGDAPPLGDDHPPLPRRPRERRYSYGNDDEETHFAAPSPRRSQPPREREAPTAEGASTPKLQDQADRILAQASEIGFSVLTKASMFWKEGKEKVQKVYEERAASAGGSTDRGFPPARADSSSRDTRPKWMQDVAAAAAARQTDDHPTSPTYNHGAFRDEHDDEEEGSAFRDHDDERQHRPGPSRVPEVPRRPPPQTQPEVDLFSSPVLSEPSEPKVYVSPFRRKKPTPETTAPPPPANISRVASSSRPTPTPPSRRQQQQESKPKRRLPSCPDANTLEVVRQNKIKGTDAFKLGQFSVAAESYSKAITILPTKHLLLIPLYTNRALARIRCGECKDAVEDASEALSIIANGATWETWQPTNEDGGWELDGSGRGEVNGGYGVQREKGTEWNDTWGRGVDLRDGWIKAVRRRAEALEGMEKWTEARKDWEVLTGAGWVDGKTREEAVRGLGRCKKMIAGGDVGTSGPASNGTATAAPQIKPRPRPTPKPSPSNAAPSVAVKAYRAQVSAAEAEDALKHQLKDAVEARLLAWKKGKETNLRALLASLDLVLWEEVIKDMGGKPGLADLVSSGGVKKWYMKSVSRVHPDKLNTNNSSVEQRMLAGGVFGALNEAWLAFKQ